MRSITSVQNPIIKQLKTLSTRKGRMQEQKMLVEGEVMIREALACGMRPYDALLAEPNESLEMQLTERGADVYQTPRHLIDTVCDTVTPQGVCASFSLPADRPITADARRWVALDGVQDAGNAGTIWRTADAAGLDGIWFGAGSADPLSPKVVRAAMGSAFRVGKRTCADLAATLADFAREGYQIIVSALDGADMYRLPPPGERWVLVIGNEAHGVSEAVRRVANASIKIPMRGGAESLNAAVAAGILMYALTNDG